MSIRNRLLRKLCLRGALQSYWLTDRLNLLYSTNCTTTIPQQIVAVEFARYSAGQAEIGVLLDGHGGRRPAIDVLSWRVDLLCVVISLVSRLLSACCCSSHARYLRTRVVGQSTDNAARSSSAPGRKSRTKDHRTKSQGCQFLPWSIWLSLFNAPIKQRTHCITTSNTKAKAMDTIIKTDHPMRLHSHVFFQLAPTGNSLTELTFFYLRFKLLPWKNFFSMSLEVVKHWNCL